MGLLWFQMLNSAYYLGRSGGEDSTNPKGFGAAPLPITWNIYRHFYDIYLTLTMFVFYFPGTSRISCVQIVSTWKETGVYVCFGISEERDVGERSR